MAMTQPAAWSPLLGLGRLYGLAGTLFRDEFEPYANADWPEAWRESLASWGGGAALEAESDSLLQAFREAVEQPDDAHAERSRLLLLADCPAYETTYLDAFARPRELADIAGFYHAFGVRSSGEREDHLAVECEFLAFLCVKEALALASELEDEAARCRDARAAFLADHVGAWVRYYETDLASRARLAILPAAAAVVRALVLVDAADLGVTVHERSRNRSEDPDSVPTCGPAPPT